MRIGEVALAEERVSPAIDHCPFARYSTHITYMYLRRVHPILQFHEH